MSQHERYEQKAKEKEAKAAALRREKSRAKPKRISVCGKCHQPKSASREQSASRADRSKHVCKHVCKAGTSNDIHDCPQWSGNQKKGAFVRACLCSSPCLLCCCRVAWSLHEDLKLEHDAKKLREKAQSSAHEVSLISSWPCRLSWC